MTPSLPAQTPEDDIRAVEKKLRETIEASINAEAALAELEDFLETAQRRLCAAQTEKEEEERLDGVAAVQKQIKEQETAIKNLSVLQKSLEQKMRMFRDTSPHRGE